MESMFGISAQTPSPLFRMEVASQGSTSWRSHCEHRRSNLTESFSAVFVSDDNGVNSDRANHVIKNQDGGVSLPNGVVNDDNDDDENIDETETSSLLTSNNRQEPDNVASLSLSPDKDSMPLVKKEDLPIESSSPIHHEKDSTPGAPNEDSNETSETTELLISEDDRD
uniref:Uncharacterized protein n=1 Tax=Magallana gigas TaxID=29159 RepID=A0A8W8IQ86_MAGGI